jgi:hypothetical protein
MLNSLAQPKLHPVYSLRLRFVSPVTTTLTGENTMTNYYTENLSEFGARELGELHEILTAWLEKGLPNNFCEAEVRPAMNKASGYVFLVNEDYQVAMLNGDSLEIYHTLPYSGIEGFLCDIIDENNPEDMNSDDLEYIFNEAETANILLQKKWQKMKSKF